MAYHSAFTPQDQEASAEQLAGQLFGAGFLVLRSKCAVIGHGGFLSACAAGG